MRRVIAARGIVHRSVLASFGACLQALLAIGCGTESATTETGADTEVVASGPMASIVTPSEDGTAPEATPSTTATPSSPQASTSVTVPVPDGSQQDPVPVIDASGGAPSPPTSPTGSSADPEDLEASAGSASGGASNDPVPGEPEPLPEEPEALPEEPEAVPTTDCEFAVMAELSDAISTVGIVTFTTTLGTLDAGQIEFGLDTAYGMSAPIDVEATGYRTLLLGMTPETTYHYRILAQAGGEVCVSDDAEITTGPMDSAVLLPTLSPEAAAAATPGFLVVSNQSGGGGGGGGGGMVVIFDKQGQPVWWSESGIGGATRARMTWDGRYMYARDGNPSGANMGQVVRISMDGLEAETVAVPYSHHDVGVMPDGGMLFFTSDGSEECDTVTKLSTDGELIPIYDVRQAFGDAFDGGSNDPCHCNSIHYNVEDDSISFSCLNQNAYVKITAEGELLWVLGGNNGQSHFTGNGSEWDRQHGHDFITPTRFVFFNNNGSGGSMDSNSLAVEVELDLVAMTATRVWEYDGGNASQTLGDATRLPNGNTLITYSNPGVIHEVNPSAELVQEWDFPSGIGYVEYRDSLYGRPLYP